MKTKTILSIALALIFLCSCVSNEVSTNDSDDYWYKYIDESGEPVEYESLEEVKKRVGISKEDTLNSMLDADGFWSNIVIGTAVKEITHDYKFADLKKGKGPIYANTGGYFLFKITDNLTENKLLPEYIRIRSQYGVIFEHGKEYCIGPSVLYNTLWDSHIISCLTQIISRELLTDAEIESIRKAHADWDLSWYYDTVIKEASLNAEFLSKVDLALLVTITSKQKELYTESLYGVDYELKEILYSNKEYAEFVPEWISVWRERINTDVNVGGTYIIMLSAKSDGAGGYFTMPSARKGAVVSEKASDFVRYERAFRSLAINE